MPIRFALCVAGALLLIAPIAHAKKPDTGDTVQFNRDIRPILSDKCFFCHGPDEAHREGGLRLDEKESAFGEADSGEVAVVPGNQAASELIRRILSEDEDERMPKVESGKTLSKQEITLLRRWIEQGADWQEHWAYEPPSGIAPPATVDRQWPKNWVDRFVRARLQHEGLQPSPDADRTTLIRRLYFDLTGLPPTPGNVAEFVSDQQPDAYERLVDRLLDSPHYGERMAMYWLDLVRYADTVGYHGDQDHNIAPYREYVIDAFNDNMPLDQFTREQLAGDLIAKAGDGQHDAGRVTDLKIASGYNRLLQTSHEGGVQKKEYLAIYAADRIRNLSNVWMAATMGCCQCHDHKFDPYTARDFYSMVSFFADIDENRTFSGANTIPTNREPELDVLTKRQRLQIDELNARIVELKNANSEDLESEQIERLVAQRDQIKQQTQRTMITVTVPPRTIRILPRGNWLDDSGEIVLPAVPGFLGKLETGDRRATRLDLANWLTDDDHGVGMLTARVFVNRFWYLMFRSGIAKALDDFGGQGEPPVHPELLDALAVEFVNSDWDVKHMIRLLVTSRAYRQSSAMTPELRARDPANRLFARQSRYRLSAELVRDTALAISGLLVLDYGGASARPYQPAGYYRHLNFPVRRYSHDEDRRQWRRGVYIHWQRQFLHPMLKAFDAPTREECTAARPRSNTPLAALVLLNDPTFVEAARVFATRILREGGDTTRSRLNFAMQWTVSRNTDSAEQEILTALLQESLANYRDHPQAAQQLVRVGQAAVAEDLDAIRLASWSAVARALLNMKETIERK